MHGKHVTLYHWLALWHAPGVGPMRFTELLQRYPEPAQLFRQGNVDPDLGQALRDYLRQPDHAAVERDLAWLEADPQRHILTLDDARYPALLHDIPDRPPLLYLHGDIDLLDTPQLAMVGSRNPTATGSETAFDFARHLAAVGITITSGLALGVDAASHRGALKAKGSTIAVFGTGLDRVYPARHKALAHEIVAQGGLLVAEMPPGTPPLAGNFPRRNRIISGLSLGTLVVEAALRSGSLITARMAAEQGREVFAIPGSIHNPLARGCHRLIREGAKLVETAEDVLEELAPHLREALDRYENQSVAATTLEPLDAEYQHLLGCLGDEPTAVDTLVERSGLTAEAISSMLLLMELRGLVATAPGGYMRTSLSASNETRRI